MIAGVRGRLLTASFVRDVLPTLEGAGVLPPSMGRHLAQYARRLESLLGAASSVRAITDVALLPLVDLLGLTLVRRADGDEFCRLELEAATQHLPKQPVHPSCGVVAVATGWGEPLERVWRSSVIGAIGADVRWCLCCNGRVLRLLDGRRTWSRDYIEFDLAALGRDAETQSVLWAIARADAFAGSPPFLDNAVALSSRYGVHVCRALGAGVLDALEALLGAFTRSDRGWRPVLWEQSLTVVYRVLFLLFAEARGLVPLWHPLYRERYSLEAIVSALLAGRPYKGLWRAVHAISRLAHAGCAAGDLRVTAFNGRLFSPAHASVFDSTPISNAVMRKTVVALSSTPAGRAGGRARILYRDLDVEQLGAVYERVLEYEPASTGSGPLVRTRDVRKSSGAFYTPRAVTTFLVRRTLEPLVRDRSADDILSLRVLDPAMGSGAFLVAACRYLASAVEEALIREGRWYAHDVTPADRVGLRREVASRCLFGVDLNPMAVQLARLSLWLATLAADKPLSFLDHHLVAGHSLIGATTGDLERQPGGSRDRKRQEPHPLFAETELPATLAHAARVLVKVSSDPDDSAEVVRTKERIVRELQSHESLLRWTRALDLWCAAWFWGEGTPPDRGTFLDLVARLRDRPSSLPRHVSTRLLDHARDVAARHQFLHWPLTFPDVFAGPAFPVTPSGFDAIVGNPPWDMVRGDSGRDDTKRARRQQSRQLLDFVRRSGIYRVESRAHVNLYQLFVERALQLVRPGGRIGLVVPSGLVSDAGAAPLRRHLFDRAAVDEIAGLDNRLGIFPVHRSVRFVLLTCTPGTPTGTIRCRFGLSSADELDSPDRPPLLLNRRFVARLSGDDDLGIPEIGSERDLAVLERISAAAPRLSSREGWHAEFGRELNATDDRGAFVPATANSTGRLVVEGKHVDPFRVSLRDCRLQVSKSADEGLRVPKRPRLAYRDVASATNRLTLIAAVVPARAITTHTLFCLKTPLPLASQRVLAVLLNSYVANYLVRLRVNTHVTVSLVSRLPVPVVAPGTPLFTRLDTLGEALSRGGAPVEEMQEYAEAQALAAHRYGLTAADFEHVLSTFPLVPEEVRERVLERFNFYSSRQPLVT